MLELQHATSVQQTHMQSAGSESKGSKAPAAAEKACSSVHHVPSLITCMLSYSQSITALPHHVPTQADPP